MSLTSDVAALKAWKRTRFPALSPDQIRQRHRLNCARRLYADHRQLWERYQADPVGLWGEALIDFGLDWVDYRRRNSGQPGAILVSLWNLSDAIIPFMDQSQYDRIPLDVVVRFLNGDDQAGEEQEFGELLTTDSGELPTTWFDCWLLCVAAGSGLYVASRDDEVKAIRVTGKLIEERRRFESWQDVRPEIRRIKRNLKLGEVLWNEYQTARI
jgi:hypothetical protein